MEKQNTFPKKEPALQDWYSHDIRLTYSNTYFENREKREGHSQGDTIRLHFGLSGDYVVDYPQFRKHFELTGGHQNLFYSKGFDMQFENKTENIETFGIQFPKKLFLSLAAGAGDDLERFAEKIDRGENVLFAPSWAPIGIRSQQVIQEIVNNNYRGDLQELFLYAKSIELLVLSVESFEHHHSGDGAGKKPNQNKQDKEKILAARDIINERLNDPPTLAELAKLVTLNEYKLKTGFKALFDSTVFDYLNVQRLALAFRLLQDGSYTAAEVAYQLGYATPQHFNNAFRKKYGQTPNMVRKNP